MPLNAPLTEDFVRTLAPDEASFKAASEISQSSRLQNLGTSSDGTWMLGEFTGMGPAPYKLSADFHIPNQPVLQSTSPSRYHPDKYTLGMLLKYAHNPDSFGVKSPSIELLARREKVLAAEERKKGVFAKKGGKKDEEKKQLLRLEALEAANHMLVDLAAKGNWFSENRAEQFEKLCKQLNEASLPSLAAQFKRVALVGKEKGLKDPEKNLLGASALANCEAVLKKTIHFLGTDTSKPSEEDYLLEQFLDMHWSISDLKARGYGKTDLSLFELAYERLDDEGRATRMEVSNLLDLNTGELHQSVAYRPFKGLTPIPEQVSYTTPIHVPDAVLYPGSLNRRVRWEKNSETTGVSSSEALEATYGHAIPEFEPVIDEFRSQLEKPFAPTEAVLLLRCAKLGKVNDKVVVEDSNGGRLELRDRRKDYSHLFNFKRAAAMLRSESPALLVRLAVSGKQIIAYPLAMITPKHHLKIGV
ncbi:hypothetical protein KIH39_05320 [Telmatocola sphagniphila]|uniref:Uncharacterized protein n=1 Tax=Telmatocola sphagniphila TaxID=1123043 RepID=A0A8E6BAD6_9BACT|nr:hypothetical protein [Telmatocola sphagniphila]QVL33335.1 hypothetical protein KIH39_05320 [Telmatocola sphagniphila]